MTAATIGRQFAAVAGALEPVGLDAACEAVYRAMLARPYESVGRLAQQAGLSMSDVHRAIQRLAELRLVRSSDQREGQVWAVSPHLGMEILLARQQAELAARQLQLENCRVAVAELLADCPLTLTPAVTGTQHVLGLDRLTDLVAMLAQKAHTEVVGFRPNDRQASHALDDFRPFDRQLRDGTLSARYVYLDVSYLAPAAVVRAGWLSELGAQIRTTDALPSWMIIIDRAAALVPVRADQPADGALLLTSEGPLAALCALFDLVWATAQPLSESAQHNRHGLSVQQATVARLLAEGLTDDAIGRRLGISPRSARRAAGDLMARLGARSRFQAGALAVHRGWINAERAGETIASLSNGEDVVPA